MKSNGARGRVAHLCAAVVLACVLSPSSAREPTAEQDADARAPASAPGTTQDGTEQGMPANRPGAKSKPCSAAGNRGGANARDDDPTVLRKLVCWWQDGLSQQSRALIP